MDEKTTNANPFKPLVCHKILKRKSDAAGGRMVEQICGEPAMRYNVTGKTRPYANITDLPFMVTAWLCKRHAKQAQKEGYKLE
jgi:hypothetical protein